MLNYRLELRAFILDIYFNPFLPYHHFMNRHFMRSVAAPAFVESQGVAIPYQCLSFRVRLINVYSEIMLFYD